MDRARGGVGWLLAFATGRTRLLTPPWLVRVYAGDVGVTGRSGRCRKPLGVQIARKYSRYMLRGGVLPDEVIGPASAKVATGDALDGLRVDVADITLHMPIKRGVRGQSAAFLAVGDDGKEYWVKPLNNLVAPRMCVTEQIVGRVGALIGAPTVPVKTMRIPPELCGWKFHETAQLEPGVAHASLAGPHGIETSQLEKRGRDANASRHVFVIALYDLCWGDDPQWNMDLENDWSFYSFDHGNFFPDGPFWDSDGLRRCLNAPRVLQSGDSVGFDRGAIDSVIATLTNLSADAVRGTLTVVPKSWPVSDAELEDVGAFIMHRAPGVAARLRERFGL